MRLNLSHPEVRIADVRNAPALSDLRRREAIIAAVREVFELATSARILGLPVSTHNIIKTGVKKMKRWRSKSVSQIDGD